MDKKNNATGKYVKPFTALEVKRIKAELIKKKNKRNYCLFTMAVNQGIRSTDLLKLRVKDVEDLKIGEKFFFKEGKTGKQNFIFMNRNTHQALHLYLEFQNMYGSDGYLFPSRKGC